MHQNLKMIRLILYVTFLAVTVGYVNGQPKSVNERLLYSIAQNDIKETSRLIDSAKIDIKEPIYNELTFLDFVIFVNSTDMLKEILKKPTNIDHDDFLAAAIVGNPDNITEILNAMNSTDIEDYIAPDLFTPITEYARSTIVDAFLKQVSLDTLEEILGDVELRDSDTRILEIWLNKLAITFPPAELNCRLEEYALDTNLKFRIKNSCTTILLQRYFYSNERNCLKRADEFLTLAIENNNWTIVEKLMAKGIMPSFTTIDIKKVEDKDILLGLMVKNQLIDLDPQGKALDINRNWKMPDIKISMAGPGNSSKKGFEQIAKTNESSDFIFGQNTITMEGNIVPFTFENLQMARVVFRLNIKLHEAFTGWQKEFTVSIPQSDTLSWGTYHTVRIENIGTGEGREIGNNKLIVTRAGVELNRLSKYDSEDYSRALGPIEIRGTMELPSTFGFRIAVAHEEHKKLSSCNIETRLMLYQKIMQAKVAQRNINSGQGLIHDAMTACRLYSEQLAEAKANEIINGELRIAMKNLAEQSAFNSSFANYIYQVVLDSSVPNALESFLSSPDPNVRTQAENLSNALNQKDEALKLLEAQNINSYLSKIRQVKGLIYELAQYCSTEKLLKYLNDNIMSLSSPLRKSFKENSKNSLQILDIDKKDLNGKGEAILSFLSL